MGIVSMATTAQAKALYTYPHTGKEVQGDLTVTSTPALAGMCDTVNQTAGYFDISGSKDKHYFYWFFESRSRPEYDPIILWMTGVTRMLLGDRPFPRAWTVQGRPVRQDEDGDHPLLLEQQCQSHLHRPTGGRWLQLR